MRTISTVLALIVSITSASAVYLPEPKLPTLTNLLYLIQNPLTTSQIATYKGFHAAVFGGELSKISDLIKAGTDLEARDGSGRTPLMVAGYMKNHKAAKLLIKAGANLNALENSTYDLLTISSVLNDIEMVKLAIASGADTGLITSPYDGTALIAAAHLGHVEVVKALIAGKAPLDRVNNLNWTALIESIVLGDGGPNHMETLRTLVDAGADVTLADGNGVKPLAMATRRSYTEMVEILKAAGATP